MRHRAQWVAIAATAIVSVVGVLDHGTVSRPASPAPIVASDDSGSDVVTATVGAEDDDDEPG